MWLKPQGYAEITTPDFGLANLDHIREAPVNPGVNKFDTATCFHCGRAFHVSPRMRPEDIGGLCKTCMHTICPRCLDKPCTPLEKLLDDLENRMERKRAVDAYF